VSGTDGTQFGCEWTSKALAEARIGDDARAKILHDNATAIRVRLAKSRAARNSRREILAPAANGVGEPNGIR